MVLRNDYERGLFNGERGVVASSGVHFETGITDADTFTDELSTAYAITVHKSQGAELDHVVLVLPSADHPLLTRELLYTATTRARSSVTNPRQQRGARRRLWARGGSPHRNSHAALVIF